MFGFFKKGRRNPDTTDPIQTQALPYLDYSQKLDELNFQDDNSVRLALYCLNINPTLVKDLDPEDDVHLAVIKKWIRQDLSNYLLCLSNGVDHDALLTTYLVEKLAQSKNTVVDEDIQLQTSYDHKLILRYQYETKRGETIGYFDQTLGIPTLLTAHAAIKFKLQDARKLFTQVDVDLKMIDLALVVGYLTTNLNRIVRDTILSFITSKKVSFYELPQHYTVLNKGIILNLQNCFDPAGLEVVDFALSDISALDNTEELVRNQFYAIAEAERVKAHEHKMATQAMDLYERKAAIHEKYPHFPLSLTEAEKDFALNRYLNRTGKDTKLKAEINRRSLAERHLSQMGTMTPEREIHAPHYIKAPHTFRYFYAVLTAILLFGSIGAFLYSSVAGFIALGASTLVWGLVTCLNFKRLRTAPTLQPVLLPEMAADTTAAEPTVANTAPENPVTTATAAVVSEE